MLLSISVTITVTFSITIILAIFSIAIVITILPTVQIQTIDSNTEIRQFVIFSQFINQSKLCLMGIISTTYIYG